MSGIEALAAIGLASNLVQFIETALKIYKSANNNLSGLSDHYNSVQDLTTSLRTQTTTITQGVEQQRAGEDERLIEIANQCQAIAEDLLSVIESFKVGEGRSRNIFLLGKAIRAAWSKSRVQEMEQLLGKYYNQLVAHIIFTSRSRLDGLSEEVGATARNTRELLRRSQIHNDNMKDSFKDFEDRLADIHRTILSRPLSPVPSYHTIHGAPGPYPVLLGPGGSVESQSMPLHEAALKGEAKSIHQTRHGVFINTKDEDGQTALHISVLADNTKFTKSLLAEGDLDVNPTDNDRSTPLHYAVKNSSTNMVALLLEFGARNDIMDSKNKIPGDYADNNAPQIVWMLKHGVSQKAKNEALLEFTKISNVNAVEKMLALGAEATSKAKGGNQALMYAAMCGNSDITKAICANDKLSIDATNNLGQTALMLAAINGHLEVAKTLLFASPNLKIRDDKEGRTALFYSLSYAHGDGDETVDSRWAVATAMIQAGANIETKDKENLTPLALFCRLGKFAAVRWLVEQGAMANGKLGMPGESLTPLMEAASCQYDNEGACHIIQYLVNRGSDMELFNSKNGHTALFEAVLSPCLPQLKVLINCGANVNTLSKNRQLPLTIAAMRGYHEVVEVLLESGSYVTTRDYHNRLPIHYASEFKRLRCVELLINKGSPVSFQDGRLFTPLHEAADKDSYDLMLLLLQHPSTKVDLQTDDGETALQQACKLDDPRCAELLIRNGASVSLVKNNGWTPLHEASARGLERTIGALLAAGADPNAMSSSIFSTLYTPLMQAAHNGKLEACRLLVDHGADVWLRNSNGETAYHIARRHSQVQSFLGRCQASTN